MVSAQQTTNQGPYHATSWLLTGNCPQVLSRASGCNPGGAATRHGPDGQRGPNSAPNRPLQQAATSCILHVHIMTPDMLADAMRGYSGDGRRQCWKVKHEGARGKEWRWAPAQPQPPGAAAPTAAATHRCLLAGRCGPLSTCCPQAAAAACGCAAPPSPAAAQSAPSPSCS